MKNSHGSSRNMWFVKSSGSSRNMWVVKASGSCRNMWVVKSSVGSKGLVREWIVSRKIIVDQLLVRNGGWIIVRLGPSRLLGECNGVYLCITPVLGDGGVALLRGRTGDAGHCHAGAWVVGGHPASLRRAITHHRQSATNNKHVQHTDASH